MLFTSHVYKLPMQHNYECVESHNPKRCIFMSKPTFAGSVSNILFKLDSNHNNFMRN